MYRVFSEEYKRLNNQTLKTEKLKNIETNVTITFLWLKCK